MTKVKIGIPARDTVMSGFAHSLAMMVARSAVEGVEVSLTTSAGTLIADQRNNLAKAALDEGCDYILMLDSDMVFPSGALMQLLAHQQPVVTCNYTTRRAPAEPVAFRRIGTLEKLYTDPDSEGLEECAANGMGVALIHRTVFEQTPKPWFHIPYIPESDGFWGEDVWFCNAVRKAGFPVYVDHDLSKEVRHIGMREYDFLDAQVMKADVVAKWQSEQDAKAPKVAAE